MDSKDIKAKEYFAVYGSLLKGQYNHYLIKDSEFVEKAEVKGYDLYSLGRFPVAKPSKDGTLVVEVYKIKDDSIKTSIHVMEVLAGYDPYEITINGKNCIMYVGSDQYYRVPSTVGSKVPNGDWGAYNRTPDFY